MFSHQASYKWYNTLLVRVVKSCKSNGGFLEGTDSRRGGLKEEEVGDCWCLDENTEI